MERPIFDSLCRSYIFLLEQVIRFALYGRITVLSSSKLARCAPFPLCGQEFLDAGRPTDKKAESAEMRIPSFLVIARQDTNQLPPALERTMPHLQRPTYNAFVQDKSPS